MIYVDDSLCTGCGLCADACRQGAISLHGAVAAIDETRCTLCGRCTDVCPTGAIISAEIISDRLPDYALEQYQQTRPLPTGAIALHSGRPDSMTQAATPPVLAPTATSKLELAQRLLSGLFSVVNFAVARKQGRSTLSSATNGCTGNGSGARGGMRTAHSRGTRARRGAQVRGPRGRGRNRIT